MHALAKCYKSATDRQRSNQMMRTISTFVAEFFNCRNVRTAQDRNGIETLAAFVRDAEHDVLSVVTALQAHVDLLQDEIERNHIAINRFVILNRAIARIATDVTVLSAFSDHVRIPPCNQKQLLEGLMADIAVDTKAAFDISQVSLVCRIAKGTTLIGSPTSLKVMITAMVLAVLNHCQESETINVVGLAQNGRVTLSVDTVVDPSIDTFKPWNLGELHKNPSNGDSISVAAIEAMARMHHGQLSMSTLPDSRHGYRLMFDA
jgi:hypothetical protein